MMNNIFHDIENAYMKKKKNYTQNKERNFVKAPSSQNFVTTHSRKTHLTSFISVCVFFIFVGFSVTFTMVSFFFLPVKNNHQDQFNTVQILQLGQVSKDHFDTVNPLLSPQWGGGCLFNLSEAMVTVLHKELECKVEKLKNKKLKVMQLRIENKSELPVGE